MSRLFTSDSTLILEMSRSNDNLLERYLDSRRLKPDTMKSYKVALISYERSLGTPLIEASNETIQSWYKQISGEGKTAGTILNYANCLNILYRYHLKSDLGIHKNDAKIMANRLFEDLPIKDLRAEVKKGIELRDTIITKIEFMALMLATGYVRLKAQYAILYETACRRSEIFGKMGLKIRDITFAPTCVECRVIGKTGERTAPLIRSIPYLRAWLQIHPDRNNPDAPLFCTVQKGKIKAISPDSINVTLTRLCKVAGIRHIHPHMFRHTRLTHLAKMGMGEYLMKKFAGWTPDSKMAARYIKLSGRDHIETILKLEGVQVEKKKPKPISLIEMSNCPNCDRPIGLEMPFCPNCSYLLDDIIGVGRIQSPQIVEETEFEKRHAPSRLDAFDQRLRNIETVMEDFRLKYTP